MVSVRAVLTRLEHLRLGVSEIRNSREQFEEVRERLLEAVSEAGVEFSAEPEIFDVHNIERR